MEEHSKVAEEPATGRRIACVDSILNTSLYSVGCVWVDLVGALGGIVHLFEDLG